MNALDDAGMSLDEALVALIAPGAPFEMQEVSIGGRAARVWKNAPAHLAALACRALQHESKLFTVYEDERVSYEASFRATAHLARWLKAQGIGRGDRVAIGMRNLPEWPVIFFAITGLGAIAVPLNAWWAGPELAHGLADSGAAMTFVDAERAERLLDTAASSSALPRMVVTRAAAAPVGNIVSLEDLIGCPAEYATLPAATLPEAHIDPDDAAAIFYTSGTTGVPKGALGSHRNLLMHTLTGGYAAARDALRSGKTLSRATARVRLITVPLFHVTGCVAGLISGIPAGNTNIFMRKWDPLEAMRLIQVERVNLAGGVPTMVWQILNHPDRQTYDLSSLETVSFGGAPHSADLVQRVQEELCAVPGVGWGMTETMSTVVSLSGRDLLAHPSSCGLPVPVADIKVRDPMGGLDLPNGEIGELWVKGPMVTGGFWNQPKASAEVFVDGWLRTGDLARLDDEGFCTLVDRLKDVIIRGGENIYCAEVENVLSGHPRILEAALIGVPHSALGEEPVAIVRLTPGHPLTEVELQTWVRARLAAYKTPVCVRFMHDVLPRNAGGKVLKERLREWFESGATPASPAPGVVA